MGNVEYCVNCMNPLGQGKFCPSCGKDRNERSHAAHVIPPGTLLHGRYLIGGVIGQGGFGITYNGRDTLLDSAVAIKECFPSVLVDRMAGSLDVTPRSLNAEEVFAKCLSRFTNEARLLRKMCANKSVVDVLDLFEENKTAYMVMERLQGSTLEDMIAQSGPMSAEAVFTMMEPVIDALQEMHSIGLLHRDLSPDNIMILQDGHAVLMDFGAARTLDPDSNGQLSVVLKPSFSPLEQHDRKGNQGPWSDIYALCATMYRCITGVVPQSAPMRLAGDQLKTPSQLGVSMHPAQEQALMRGLSVKAENRQQTASQLKEELLGAKSPSKQSTIKASGKISPNKDEAMAGEGEKASSRSSKSKASYQTISMSEMDCIDAVSKPPKDALETSFEKPASESEGIEEKSSSDNKAEQNASKRNGKKIFFALGAIALIASIALLSLSVTSAPGVHKSDDISVREIGQYSHSDRHYRVVQVGNEGNTPVYIEGKSQTGFFNSCEDSTPMLAKGESSILLFEYKCNKDDQDSHKYKDTYEAKKKSGKAPASSDLQVEYEHESKYDGVGPLISVRNNAEENAHYDFFCLFFEGDQLTDVYSQQDHLIHGKGNGGHYCKTDSEFDSYWYYYAAEKDTD